MIIIIIIIKTKYVKAAFPGLILTLKSYFNIDFNEVIVLYG